MSVSLSCNLDQQQPYPIMRFILLSMCIMGHAFAAPMTTTDPHAGHDHTKPCCMPKRWQAVLLDLNSPTALQYATVYAYDADLKVEGSISIRVDDEAPVYWTFTDYKSMMTYSVAMYGDPSTHKCVTSKASHDFYDHCFMSSASTTMLAKPVMFAESVLGPAMGGIPFHAWKLQLASMDVSIALSTDDCTPLVEIVKGTDNGRSINSIFSFNEFSTNVTSPELLAIPAACASMP